MDWTDDDPRLAALRPWVERQRGRPYDAGPLDGEDCPSEACNGLCHAYTEARVALPYHDRAHLLGLVFGDGGTILCYQERRKPWVWILVDSNLAHPDGAEGRQVVRVAQDHRGDLYGRAYHDHDEDCEEGCDYEGEPFPAVEDDVWRVVLLDIDTAEALRLASEWGRAQEGER